LERQWRDCKLVDCTHKSRYFVSNQLSQSQSDHQFSESSASKLSMGRCRKKPDENYDEDG
jgi:hypothetical protein